MAFEIPSDLIRQVQTLIREEVGLSSYDPLDPTLPTLPSLRESIASFDQSAPTLRCYRCKGNLLRGLESSICVYCGKFQPKDVLPDPINFKSTCGYKWLLQSLDLDGSETVTSSTEESVLSKRRTSRKEVPLSDLLDLKIIFHSISDKDDISIPEDAALQNKPSLDVSGNEFDNFFPEPRQESESGFQAFEEHQVEGKQVEKIENIDQMNIQNEKSSQFQKEESFSGWEADFQFADSGIQHETATSSSEPKLSSQVDLSAHLDSVFGSSKELDKGTSATSDWTQDDSWNNAKGKSIHMEEEGQVSTAIKSPDGIIVDWFTNEQQQAGTTNEPENTWGDFADFTQYKRHDDQIDVVAATQPEREKDFVDSINGWGDFATEQKKEINFVSIKNSQEGDFGSRSSNTQLSPTKKDNYSNTANTITTTSPGEQDDGSLDDMWDDFTRSTVIDQTSGDHIAGFPEHRDDNFVGTNNIQEMNFDLFSVADRSNAVDFGVVENKKSKAEDEIGDIPNNLPRSPEVDMAAALMSQMHDLSFMLKDELSIP